MPEYKPLNQHKDLKKRVQNYPPVIVEVIYAVRIE